MTEAEKIDEGFMYVLGKLGTPANDKDNPNSKDGTELDVRRVLSTLYKIGFADRTENKQRTNDNNRVIYDYWLNSEALHFKDTLPLEFKDKPYSYHLKLESDKDSLKRTRDDLDEKVKKITIGNIRLNKYTTILSLTIALCAIFVPIVIKKMSEGEIIKMESTLPQLKQVLENHNRELQMLQDNLDSLQKLLKHVSK